MSDLLIGQVAVQVDLDRSGYRFMDHVGALAAYVDEAVGNVQWDGQTLTGVKNNEPLSGMRANVDIINVQFTLPDTTQFVLDHATKHVRAMSELAQAGTAKGFVLQVQYIAGWTGEWPEFSSRFARRAVSEWHPVVEGVETARVLLEGSLADGRTWVAQAGPAEAVPEADPRFPRSALLLDVSIGQRGEAMDVGEFRSFLRAAMVECDRIGKAFRPLVEEGKR